MATYIGALLDVSRSMDVSIGDGVHEDEGTWARSIFRVIDDLIKHDVSNANRAFAVGVGGNIDFRYPGPNKEKYAIFDIIGTIQAVQRYLNSLRAEADVVDECFTILERNGAGSVRKWADKNIVLQTVSKLEAKVILKKLRSDTSFRQKFVYEYLPKECRDWTGQAPEYVQNVPGGAYVFGLAHSLAEGTYTSTLSTFVQASTDDIKQVVEKAMDSIDVIKDVHKLLVQMLKDMGERRLRNMMEDVSENSVFGVQEAADIIRGRVNERELTTQRAKELLAIVEPLIFGYTPFYTALKKATGLLSRSHITYPNYARLLFVLSDGDPTDDGNIGLLRYQLRAANVTVVGCYIHRSTKVEPRKLYNIHDDGWEDGAKLLFYLSSKIPTELVTRAIFIKHGWQIDITNNETKLFLHVNHPDHLQDACNLARNAVCCKDTLSDLLASVDLDISIYQKNSSVEAHGQTGNTCYANAAAAVLHLSMIRILGRDDGYPDFNELRDYMIKRFDRRDSKGEGKGATTSRVLRTVCPKYRLHSKDVDVDGAMKAVAEKRPVVATFFLDGEKWDNFKEFYHNDPTAILEKRHLENTPQKRVSKDGGHAVVLTSFSSQCFRLMNSWGDCWADKGFFRIRNAKVLGLKFIDVYWTLDDLSQKEKDYYRKHGSKVADKLMGSLKGLQMATYNCPLCSQASNVTEFHGTSSTVTCPQCNSAFSTKDSDGNILALNMYLASLTK